MKRTRLKNVELLAAMASERITGRALADQCGVHPVTVSAILNKRVDPKPETKAAIAGVLGVSIADLFKDGGRE